MMIVERDAIYLAKLPKSVGLVSRIAPPHSGARAELRESEAPRDPFEFVGHETIVEADIMGDENAVPHELHEIVRYLSEQRCVPNHFVRDAGQLNDLCGNGSVSSVRTPPTFSGRFLMREISCLIARPSSAIDRRVSA